MFICAICGLKQTGLREEKALAGFDTIGHSGSYIQSIESMRGMEAEESLYSESDVIEKVG